METRAHYVAVGAFVLAVIFLAFVAVLWLGHSEFSHTKRYYIFFRGSVAGLNKGSKVQYNGIPIGQVVDIGVDPDDVEKIQVTVEIDTSILPIKTNARAFLESNILNGVATIQIRGGTQEAKELEPEPNKKYAVIAAGQSELEQLKANLPELLGDLKDVADSLQNVRTVTENFVAPSKEVSEVVENANEAVLALKSFFGHVDQSYIGKG